MVIQSAIGRAPAVPTGIVAIVALLEYVDDPVAAGCRCTRDIRIGTDICRFTEPGARGIRIRARIAAFIVGDQSISTDRYRFTRLSRNPAGIALLHLKAVG
jgi:hypothetical protein